MNDHSRRLGTESVLPLLARMSIPAITGMLVQALYNLTDAIFVGRGIGSLGLAGITIALPVQLVVIAVAQAFGLGGASIVSRSLGSDDRARANRTLGNLITLSLLVSGVVLTLGTLYLAPLLRLFGASDAVLPYAENYLRIMLWGSPFFVFAMAATAIVRAEGNARVAMLTMGIAGLLNIGLDPLFIFGLGMGIQGAALATVISQATTVLYILYYLFSGRSTLRAHLRDLALSWRIVRESFAIGAGSFARMIAGSITVVLINNVLGVYGGDAAITAYGIINRLFNFLLLPMFGIVQGMMPIVGYNFGAGALARVRSALGWATLASTAMAVAATVLLIGAPDLLLRLFTSDEAVLQLGRDAIRIVPIAIPTVGYQVIAGGMYQAIGRAFPAFVLALLRQVLLLMPLLLVLPGLLGLVGVWAAFPIADGVAAAVTAWMFVKTLRIFRPRPVPTVG
jgi:putative MATE family efflux protein